MMTLDYFGDQEVMVHAQLGQQPLARTTVTVTGTELGESLLFERAAS